MRHDTAVVETATRTRGAVSRGTLSSLARNPRVNPDGPPGMAKRSSFLSRRASACLDDRIFPGRGPQRGGVRGWRIRDKGEHLLNTMARMRPLLGRWPRRVVV